MEYLNKYSWTKEDDGTYTIYGVPIFAKHDDGKRKVGDSEIKDILENYQKNVASGYYSRIFIGHHNPYSKETMVDNREGAGYIDQLVEESGVLYCDFSKVPEKVFKEIQKDKYPYRSPEYASKTHRITGLALLESQEPYLLSPILKLEDEEIAIYCTDVEPELYQKGNEMPEEKKLEDNIEEDVMSEEKPEEDKEQYSEEAPEEAPKKKEVIEDVKNEVPAEQAPDKMESIMGMLKILVDALVKNNTAKDETGEIADKQIDPPQSSSISYQKNEIEEKAEPSELDKLKAKVADLESKQHDEVLNYQLKELCKSKCINYDDHILLFSNLGTEEVKKQYISTLGKMEVKSAMPEHFMSSKAKEGMRLFQASSEVKDEIAKKYLNSEDEVNAGKAIQLYQSTMKSGDSNRINMIKLVAEDMNMETFVERSILSAKSDENYFTNMTVGE